jgi:transformation/transcription domain-associated protein
MSLFDPEPRNENDPMDQFGHALLEIDMHVFQEVWIHKMEFFFVRASKPIILLNIGSFLFGKGMSFPTLLAAFLLIASICWENTTT